MNTPIQLDQATEVVEETDNDNATERDDSAETEDIESFFDGYRLMEDVRVALTPVTLNEAPR